MKRKICRYSAHLCCLVTVFVTGILLVLSCEQATGPGEDVTEVTNKLLIWTDRTSIVVNKGSANVYAKVYSDDDTLSVVKDVMVQFSVDNSATITAKKSVTGDDGIAHAVVYAGASEGTVKITATIQNFSNTAVITVIPDSGLIDTDLKLNLSSDPPVLAANGSDVSVIKAQLYDSDNNPVQGETVYFTTTLGIIIESAVTDEWGIATVNLRSVRSNGLAVVSAQYNQIVKTTTIEFSGAGIESQITPPILVADDSTKATLTISLSDASDSPVVGGIVNLSTTLGTLYSSDGVSIDISIADSSSAQGKVTAYISSDKDGKAVIRINAIGCTDSLTVEFTNYVFELTAADSEIYAGESKTLITAVLKDKDGVIQPISLDDVDFSTTLGTISPFESKDDGTVVAELTSGSSVGTANISASMSEPPVVATTTVNFIAAAIGSVVIQADRPSVRVGGSEVNIKATVYDVKGNPKSDETVTFSIVKGPGGGEEIFPPTAVTNNRGNATVTFRSGNQGSLSDGVEILAQVGNIPSNKLTLTIAGVPYSVVVGFNTGSFTMNEDGTFGVEVSVIVSDVNRNKVSDGTIVSFSLKGDVGVITDQETTMDGVASTTLIYSPSDAGKKVEIIASSGGIYDSKSLVLPGKAGTVATLEVSPKESYVLADGVSGTNIDIYLTDTNGEPLSNKTIYCETDYGEIQPSAITGDPSDPEATPGKATVTFISMASWEDLVATVKFTCGEIEKEVKIYLKGVSMDINVYPRELPSDGQSQSTVQVLVKEKTSHIPLTGQTVSFGATDGSIEGSAITDESGIATTTFTAGYNTGTVFITVSYGATLIDSVLVDIVVSGPPRSIELSFDPTSVGVQGSGRNSTLIITANVKDNKNNLVGDGHLVKFELVGAYDTNSSLSPAGGNNHESELIPTIQGIASVSFLSGTKSGTVRVKATVVDENGDPVDPPVMSETTQFIVHSGPAYLDMSDINDPFTESRMKLFGGPLNIYAGAIGTEDNKSTITVTVADRYNNPVPDSTAVYFTTTGGYITTETGFTDKNGMAPATLYVGNPFPTRQNSSEVPNPNYEKYGGKDVFPMPLSPDLKGYFDFDGDGVENDGIAIVTAYSEGVDHQGNKVTVWNYVPIVFSLKVSEFTISAVQAGKDTLYNGESMIFEVNLHDVNNNPVMGGSTLKISTTLGSLSQEEIITDSPGKTKYWIDLTNALDSLNDKPGRAFVKVELTSNNGNWAISDDIYLTLY